MFRNIHCKKLPLFHHNYLVVEECYLCIYCTNSLSEVSRRIDTVPFTSYPNWFMDLCLHAVGIDHAHSAWLWLTWPQSAFSRYLDHSYSHFPFLTLQEAVCACKSATNACPCVCTSHMKCTERTIPVMVSSLLATHGLAFVKNAPSWVYLLVPCTTKLTPECGASTLSLHL